MKKTLIIFLALITVSCKRDQEKSIDSFFANISEEVTIKPQDIYLNELTFLSIDYPNSMSYSGYCSIFYVNDNSEFELDTTSMFKVNVMDSCKLYIGEKIEYANHCKNMIPLPSFRYEFSALKDFEIDSTSQYFVQDYKFKYLLKSHFETKSMNLPKKFEHGYSKGVVLSKKNEVINWMIFW
ncbi:MAG: hypothetical protein ABUL44_00840 [Flavobacterium sp.]